MTTTDNPTNRYQYVGARVVHLDGTRGQVEKVYDDGSILVHWDDDTINQWYPNEFDDFDLNAR